MNNKRGEGMLYPCVMIVALSMILSVLIWFAVMVDLVAGTRRLHRTILDSFVTTSAIEIYDSIKNGTDDISCLHTDAVNAEIFSRSKFVNENGLYYAYTEDGTERYHISVPTLTFIESGSLKIRLTYTLYMPVYFGGIRVGEAVIPIALESRLTKKFI